MLLDKIRPRRRTSPTQPTLNTPHPSTVGMELEALAAELHRAVSKRTGTPWEREVEWNIFQRRERILHTLIHDHASALLGDRRYVDVAGRMFQHYWQMLDNFTSWGEDRTQLDQGDLSGSARLLTRYIEESFLPGVEVKDIAASHFYVDLTTLDPSQVKTLTRKLTAFYQAYSHPELDGYRPAKLTFHKHERVGAGSLTKNTTTVEVKRESEKAWRFTEYEKGLALTIDSRSPLDGVMRALGELAFFPL